MGLKPRSKGGRSGLKTRPTQVDARAFIAGLKDDERRQDCTTLLRIMTEVTGEEPTMWGSGIVGFGRYHYKYASGREGDWPRTGFAPRKRLLTVYCMSGFDDLRPLLDRLGPHQTSVSCLYLRRLYDVDLGVLRTIIERSLREMAQRYPE